MKRLALFIAATLAMAVFAAAAPPGNFVLRSPPAPVPALAMADGQGKASGLADFRGKFVLLNVWATWCVSCRKEMPTLDRLQGLLGGPSFEVVALSIDRGGADVARKFYADFGINRLGVYVDASAEAPSKLGLFGLPTTLLVDPDGREIGRLVGPAEWDAPDMVAFLKSAMDVKAGGAILPEDK